MFLFRRLLILFPICAALLSASAPVAAEDGYDLWLRYRAIEDRVLRENYRSVISYIVAPRPSPTSDIAVAELRRGLTGLLGADMPVTSDMRGAGALLVGTPANSRAIARLGLEDALRTQGPDGYLIRSATLDSQSVTVVASIGEAGALYGAFHFLRLIQTGRPITKVFIAERPRLQLRLLDHWDNLDGTIERGYGGRSLWKWDELPGRIDPRLHDYARANASIGINGDCRQQRQRQSRNPHARVPRKSRGAREHLPTLRPYACILSANFAAPKTIGRLPTADPLDPAVARWWRDKADEIYQLIPDFGGFLVKANSEGQPGPQDYDRTHADGANMLADALAPHGGIVMWRAFVYNADVIRIASSAPTRSSCRSTESSATTSSSR